MRVVPLTPRRRRAGQHHRADAVHDAVGRCLHLAKILDNIAERGGGAHEHKMVRLLPFLFVGGMKEPKR